VGSQVQVVPFNMIDVIRIADIFLLRDQRLIDAPSIRFICVTAEQSAVFTIILSALLLRFPAIKSITCFVSLHNIGYPILVRFIPDKGPHFIYFK
jgi:hypothetical protein